MHILMFIVCLSVTCNASLCAMEEEHKSLLRNQRNLNSQHGTEYLGYIESCSLGSSLSSPSTTSSTGSLPRVSDDRTLVINGPLTLSETANTVHVETQRKLNQVITNINLLDVTIKSQQTQLALLTNELGILKGKTDFLRGGKACSVVTTGGCFLALWLVFAAQYFGWSVNLWCYFDKKRDYQYHKYIVL